MHGLGAGCQSQLPLMQQTSILEWNKSQTHRERQMTEKRGFGPQIDTRNTAELRHIARVKIPGVEKRETQKGTQASLEKRVKKVQKRPGRRTRACIYPPPEELRKNNRHCRIQRGAKCAHTHHFPLPLPRLYSQKDNRLAH